MFVERLTATHQSGTTKHQHERGHDRALVAPIRVCGAPVQAHRDQERINGAVVQLANVKSLTRFCRQLR
jgi:hypothetical protein